MSIWIAAFFSYSAIAEESVIVILDKSSRSMVEVTAKNAGLFKGPGQAFLDPKTGRILIAGKIKTAQRSRRGTGIIIDNKGVIVTNAHIVDGAGRLTLRFYNGAEADAEILGLYPDEDIAYLLAGDIPEGASPLPFSDTERIRIGESVYNIGGSDLLKNPFSQGRITGLGQRHRRLQGEKKADLIQTDFDIYQGDSGGPLLDREGKLLGLFVASDESGNRASFAIPAEKIRYFYSALPGKADKKSGDLSKVSAAIESDR